MWRGHLFQEPAHETLTFRNNSDQTALPMRHLGSFLPAPGVGGAGVHWNGQTWRFLPTDFVARSHNEQRYGAACRDDMTVQDWGVTYDELEPFYDKFEYLCGIAARPATCNGQIQDGGNPFEGAARARVSRIRRSRWPTGRPCSASAAKRTRPQAVSLSGGEHVARLHQPARRDARRPAPIAASARSSAAATIPSRARRPPSCRC